MTGNIFVNYRRGDDPGTTGRLYDRLEAEFAAGQLFMDVEGHIKGGDDFVKVLQAQVAQCDVLLAVIGPRWLDIADEQGRRRLDNPEDWVRVEIIGAFRDGKRVIPVLVGGADIPRAEDLPEALQPLARRQAIRITLERFKADAQGLVNQIKSALAEVEAQRHAQTESERAALAEAERQRQAIEEARVAERVRQEAERLRSAQLAGMDPAQVAKAEELANWEFIKAKTDPAEFRDHVARFAGGPTERFAEERLAGLTWAALDRADKGALRAFLDEFPKAPDMAVARTALATIEAKEAADREMAEARTRETEAWGAVAAGTDKAKIEAFIMAWPDGRHAADARDRLRELAYGALGKRIAAVPPAVSLSVIALALWLIGLVILAIFEPITLGAINFILAPTLSGAIAGLGIFLFTAAPRTHGLWAGVLSAGLTVCCVQLLSEVGMVNDYSAELYMYFAGLTAATLVGPAMINARVRHRRAIIPTIVIPAIILAGLFGFGVQFYSFSWYDLYSLLLPISVLWSIALGLMLSYSASLADIARSTESSGLTLAFSHLVADNEASVTPATQGQINLGAPVRRSWLRRIGPVLMWLVYGLVSLAVAFGVGVALEELLSSSDLVPDAKFALSLAGAISTLCAAFFLAIWWSRRSRAKIAAPTRSPTTTTPSNSGT